MNRLASSCLVILAMAAGAPLPAQQRYVQVVDRQVVEQRLRSYAGNDSQREATLKGIFQTAGCTGDNLSEQTVKGLKQPNIICVLPGNTGSEIVVGAHFDHVDRGDGVVDNWSGTSLLPSLYQALRAQPRRYTFVFLAFAGEEKGLVGSRYYAKSLTPEQIKKIDAMVNIDTLGLGPTEVWVNRSDKTLVGVLIAVARSLKLPLTGMNVDGVGESDEKSFIARAVPTIMVHSVTDDTLSVLHSSKDKYSAIRFDDYYDSCKLLSGYLATLDELLTTPKVVPAKAP